MPEPKLEKPKLSICEELWGEGEGYFNLSDLISPNISGVVMSMRSKAPTQDNLDALIERSKSYKEAGVIPFALHSSVSTQCFGRIFSGPEQQDALLGNMENIAEVASHIGIKSITFGGASLRNGAFIENPSDFTKGVDFFNRLSAIGTEFGLRFMVESCPEVSGCDFGRNLLEVSEILSNLTETNGIGIHLNVGNLLMEEEMIKFSISSHGATSTHAEVCDPFGKPMGDDFIAEHRKAATALFRLRSLGHGPDWITVSGKKDSNVPQGDLAAQIRSYVETVSSVYLDRQPD